MSTYFPSGKNLESQRNWYLVDAQGMTVGRLASRIAPILMGKNKPSYTPFLDVGDHVVIINAAQINLTGNKLDAKVYYSHSGYPGGLKEITARKLLAKHPERILELAVRRMLPKTKIGEQMFKKLRVYAGSDHPHQAQMPKSLTFETK